MTALISVRIRSTASHGSASAVLKTVILALALLSTLIAAAVDCRQEERFRIDTSRAERIAEHSKMFNPDKLQRVARYYDEPGEGHVNFHELCLTAAKQAEKGDFSVGPNTKGYINAVSFRAAAVVWWLTKDPEVGRFIHDRMLYISSRPRDFWLHADRFPSNAKAGVASLLTGHLTYEFALAMALAPDCFTPKERAVLAEALRCKGLLPMQRFIRKSLKRKHINNWNLVIATGLLATAKVLGDDAAAAQAVRHIKLYVDSCIETDGSYGEGPSYLAYPVGVLMSAVNMMSDSEIKMLLDKSPLANSAQYLMYSNVFSRLKGRYIRLMFRDGSQFGSPVSPALWFLATVYNDKMAMGYFQHFQKSPKSSFQLVMLRKNFSIPDGDKGAFRSLPRLGAFNNGEVYLRSDWKRDGTVLALLTGGRTRTGWSHDRPARNGIAFAAKGEYMLVTPGCSSYRGSVYINSDTSTRANNCITLDGKNQKFHGTKALATPGVPDAKLLLAREGEICDVIVSDATGCYPEPVTEALRAVIYVRDPGYFVVFDRFAAAPESRIASFFHFNNVDGKAVLNGTGTGRWQLERPRADLTIFCFAAQKFTIRVNPSIMQFQGTYHPDDPRIGKPGSSLELEITPEAGAGRFDAAMVFAPQGKGYHFPISGSGNGKEITIDVMERSDKFKLDGDTIVIDIGGKSEVIEFKKPKQPQPPAIR